MAFKSHRSVNRKHWFEWGYGHAPGTLLSIELGPIWDTNVDGKYRGFTAGFTVFYWLVFFFEYSRFFPTPCSCKKEVYKHRLGEEGCDGQCDED